MYVFLRFVENKMSLILLIIMVMVIIVCICVLNVVSWICVMWRDVVKKVGIIVGLDLVCCVKLYYN